jgi:hypothetical protein
MGPFELFKGVLALLKLSAAAIVALFVGVWLISRGDQQSIITGCGAILVGVIVIAFLGYCVFGKKYQPETELDLRGNRSKAWRLVWLGLCFGLAPGLLYLYLSATMNRFDPMAIVFVAVPLETAGIGLMVYGLLTIASAV